MMHCCSEVCLACCDARSHHSHYGWCDDLAAAFLDYIPWTMWSLVQIDDLVQGPEALEVCTPYRAPSARCKHAVVATPNDYIYLLGGRSGNLPLKDLWRFDPVQSQWEEVRTRGNKPPCLQEHTMVAWKTNIYVFGGEIGFASTGETPLWILDTVSGSWRKHHLRGPSSPQPSGRRGHSAVVHSGAMHLYGGYQDLRGSSPELWTFDFMTEQWKCTLVSANVEQPSPRHNHSAVVHDRAMWVYGGMTDLQEKGDFWRWDFVSQQWNRIKSQRSYPGELHSHSAVKVMGYMYLFGGERGGLLLNDLWRFHFATELWERIQTEGLLPNPRCRHAALPNPLYADHDEKIHAWNDNGESNDDKHGNTNVKYQAVRPVNKSISMCFGQSAEPDSHRGRPFKFKVHPVRLCSKSTGSDDEDDYMASFNPHSAQVNLSKSIKDRLSSSRLVRSISSGNYTNVLYAGCGVGSAAHNDELERLVEETPPLPHRPHIQKSQSSDAVLETDSESSTPRHRPEPAAILCKPAQPKVDCCCYHGNGPRGCDSCRLPPPTLNNLVRSNRVSYDGPLATVRDVDVEEPVVADDYMESVTCGRLVDIGDVLHQHDKQAAKVNGKDPGRGSDGRSVDHRDFAGCLNTVTSRKTVAGQESQGSGLELKTFTPTHHQSRPLEEVQNTKERARSWDRVAKRPEHVISPSLLDCELVHHGGIWAKENPAPQGMWVRSPSKARIEHHQWQLCMYMCGGREQGAPNVSRQPISMWKLYI